MGMAGLAVLGYGLYIAMVPEPARVEIISEAQNGDSDSRENGSTIYVDVAGAVEKPGVYKIPSGARIGDAIVSAGGLSEQADREWVARTMNLAQEVKDGGKIYIPANLQIGGSDDQLVGLSEGQVAGSMTGLININTASVSELDSLWGIGEARAKAIIENRPYGDIGELVDKAGIPQNVYEAIKDKISVY